VQLLYIVSVWIHILAAITWIGGMFFLVLIVVPWLRRGDRARAAALLRDTGLRFRRVGWGVFLVLALTGSFNLWFRGVRPGDLIRPEWLATPFGRALGYKLAAFALVLALSVAHDFFIGPRAAIEVERDPDGARAKRLRRLASVLGRVNVLLALLIVGLAVVLVRGWPW